MIETIGFKSLWLIARYLPTLLIRWRFSPKRLSSLVYVDVRPRHDSVSLDLHPNGSAWLYLQVINLCPTRIELDRASFSITYSGAEIRFIELEKRVFEIGEIAEIGLRAPMPVGAVDSIALSPDNPVSLHGHIEFNSPVRQFPKTIGSLSGIRPRLSNLEQRRSVASR